MIELWLPILALSLRLVAVRHSHIGSDTYGHLYFAKEVRDQQIGPAGAIRTKVVGSLDHRLPFLWHWLIGLFPIDKVLRCQKWINPGIDALFGVLIFFVALRLGLERHGAMLASLLYLLTPAWFSRLSAGARISTFTPRLASEIATNLFLISTMVPLGMPDALRVLLGALLSVFVLLSSKFGLQALLLLVPMSSLIVWSPLPTATLLLGIATTLVLTRGLFVKTVQAQLAHLSWYFRKNLHREMPVSRRNSLRGIFAPPIPNASRWEVAGVLLHRLLSRNAFTAVVLMMPVLPVALAFVVLSMSGDGRQVGLFLVGPVIAATIVFLVINIRLLLFLGEAERYLHHVAFFVVASTVTAAADAGAFWVVYLLIAYGALFWFGESFVLHKLLPEWRRSTAAADAAVMEHLQSLTDPVVVLSYPYQAVGTWRIMLETQHRVVMPYNSNREFLRTFEEKYAADAPYVRLERLDEMAVELGVGYVIAYRKSLAERGLGQWVPSSMWTKVDIGEPRYAIYRRVGS